MTHSTPDSPPSQALVDFVLRQAKVKTYLCSRQRGGDGYRLEKRIINDYNFIFVTGGTVVWVIEEREYELVNGSFVLVPPGVQHRGFSRTQTFDLTSLHVLCNLPGGQDVFELLVPPRMQAAEPGSKLDGYLRGATAEFDRAQLDHGQLMLPSWVRMVTLEMLAENARRGTLRHQVADPLIAAVLEELNRRIDQDVPLSQLSEWSGYSPQHLNRVFRRVLGVTPLQYLARIRMEQAALLLGEGRLTVRAVGRQLGFKDPYYFSRLFKQHFGQSPAQYRDATLPEMGREESAKFEGRSAK